MTKWLAGWSGQCEPVENYLAEPNDAAMEIVVSCAIAGPSESERVLESIKQIIKGKDGKRASVALHLLSLMVLGNEAIAQAIATPKWMQRLVHLAENTTKTFIRQQIMASVAKWTSLYMQNETLLANFEWADNRLNTRLQPQRAPSAAAGEVAKVADQSTTKEAAGVNGVRDASAGAGVAQPSDKVSTRLQNPSVAGGNAKISESIDKMRQSIRATIENPDWMSPDAPNKQPPPLMRKGSFSSLNPGTPMVDAQSGIIDEQRGRLDFLHRALQQVPSMMILNDVTLEDIYNPNSTTRMQDFADDIEILENFREDVQAIAGWNVLNKDNDEHLVLLQCSHLFNETARLWRKKLSGADTG